MSYFKKTSLKLGKNSLVVLIGGCTGIGRIMILKLAKDYSCRITLVDCRKDLFQSIKQQVSKISSSIIDCYYCDLTNDQSIDDMVNFISKNNKKIDFFIYNAGVLFPQRSFNHSIEDLFNLTKVNFQSPIIIINKLIGLLNTAHIAVTCSISAYILGTQYLSSYIASKQALFGFMNTFRLQLAQTSKKISLSIGCPHIIKTVMTEGFGGQYKILNPFLDQKYGGEHLLQGYINRKQIVMFPTVPKIFAKLILLLPSVFIDSITASLDKSDFTQIIKKRKQLKQTLKQQSIK